MRYPIKGKVATSTADEPNVDKWILDQKHLKNDRIKKKLFERGLDHTYPKSVFFALKGAILS